jgi:hypothetical protein
MILILIAIKKKQEKKNEFNGAFNEWKLDASNLMKQKLFNFNFNLKRKEKKAHEII